MKKLILILGLCMPFGAAVVHAQTKTAASANDPQKKFNTRLGEILTMVTTATTEDAGKTSGLLGVSKGYGQYPAKAGKGLPTVANEQYTWYNSKTRWEYHAEFGRYQADKEAELTAMKEKATKMVQDYMSTTNWKQLSSDKADVLLDYENEETKRRVKLKVMTSKTAGSAVILMLE
jgi:hypothetical protein